MAVMDVPYKNLNQVMRGIYKQIADSYDYCYDNFPEYSSPQELWRDVRPKLTFVHDPSPGDLNHVTGTKYKEETELLQSVQTLFENNIHGIPGAGDCDCFSILAIALFITQFWPKCDIVLAGRNKREAVHIYTYITWTDGYTYCIDFTEPRFNSERTYPYKQIIPITFFKS